jgi:hypothetical protein
MTISGATFWMLDWFFSELLLLNEWELWWIVIALNPS